MLYGGGGRSRLHDGAGWVRVVLREAALPRVQLTTHHRRAPPALPRARAPLNDDQAAKRKTQMGADMWVPQFRATSEPSQQAT